MLTNREIDNIVERIVVNMQPQKVIIFGSYAKGAATLKSDLDIFIIKETNLPHTNRATSLKSILFNRLIPIDIHVYTPEEVEEYSKEQFSFVNSVLKTGKVVFDSVLGIKKY